MSNRIYLLAILIIAGSIAIILTSCERPEDSIQGPADFSNQRGMTNEEIRLEWLNKGVPSVVSPLALTCPDGDCGPLDVVFVVDTTGSMTGAIANVASELTEIVGCIDAVSEGDYRLALLTFGDGVDQYAFESAPAAGVTAAISGLTAYGGAGEPEASDVAVTTATGLTWRGGATKIIILVTDARPGGLDDAYSAGTDSVNANAAADAAAAAGVKISSIYVPTNPATSATIEPIMEYYATATGGFYHKVNSDGSGTGEAILDIITGCGTGEVEVPFDMKPTSCPNPFNLYSQGVVPAAIVGTGDFDVTQVDVSTIMLNVNGGVWPIGGMEAYEDVVSPYDPYLGKADCYDCTTEGPDGYLDLTLKFDAQELAGALTGLEDGDCYTVTMTGELLDGTPIVGEDVLKIIIKLSNGKNKGQED